MKEDGCCVAENHMGRMQLEQNPIQAFNRET